MKTRNEDYNFLSPDWLLTLFGVVCQSVRLAGPPTVMSIAVRPLFYVDLDETTPAKAYTDFTLASIEQKFGVKNQQRALFAPLPPLPVSADLQKALARAHELPVRSEKAKSELIVIPILLELRDLTSRFFTIYSGDNLNADEEAGLRGECDFILAKDTGTFDINYPILQIVAAKRNDLEIGVPQCAAQLIGARLFNEKKGVTIPTLYGCVTTGDEWVFMRLTDNELVIDTRKYYLVEIGELLALFVDLINQYRTEPA